MTKDKDALAEVFEVLVKLDLFKKLPRDVARRIFDNRNKKCSYVYDFNKSLENQNISRKAKIVIVEIYCKYICNNDDEKRQIRKLIENNS